MKPEQPEPVDIETLMEDDELLNGAMRDAARKALLDHKRTGDPIVISKDGKIVWIPAEDIEIDE